MLTLFCLKLLKCVSHKTKIQQNVLIHRRNPDIETVNDNPYLDLLMILVSICWQNKLDILINKICIIKFGIKNHKILQINSQNDKILNHHAILHTIRISRPNISRENYCGIG